MADRPAPTFVELGVAAEICDSLAAKGITRTFAIQELTLPLALDGTDIIGQARTGMGKTLGFGVPLIDRFQLKPRAGDLFFRSLQTQTFKIFLRIFKF